MLVYLHVKNLALIEEAEVDFEKGLNILSGETGAGKSILIDSVNLALGAKASRNLVRTGADYAFVELVFQVTDEQRRQRLAGLGAAPEEGQIILSRRITPGENERIKSLCKVNGETVTAGLLKKIAEELIDIHGQHDHQSLLHQKKHLEILDDYGSAEIAPVKARVKAAYHAWKEAQAAIEAAQMDEEERKREAAFAEFELQEIEAAGLQPAAAGQSAEDEELEALYQKMSNAKKIMEHVSEVYEATGASRAGEDVGRALRTLSDIVHYDSTLQGLQSQLMDIDGLLSDFHRELSDYVAGLEFGEEEFYQTQERLDLINHLKAKYGNTIEEILAYKEEKRIYLEKIRDYELYMADLRKKEAEARKNVSASAKELSELRKTYAKPLMKQISNGLKDLNFLDTKFEIQVRDLERVTENGMDEVEFLISMNPGEPRKPLREVASGGELSRIMLVIKEVLADKDEVATIIFDEIDVGISGRTAQKVSEKLAVIGKNHQVLCITHLPQIAAMADTHFAIEKETKAGGTRTHVRKLGSDAAVTELARMLGGAQVTDTVMESAREMKTLAVSLKRKMSA